MRVSLGLLAACALAVATAQSAGAQASTIYPWCMQPSGLWGPDCSYTTTAQCHATAAGVGFCYQNPAFAAAAHGQPQRRR